MVASMPLSRVMKYKGKAFAELKPHEMAAAVKDLEQRKPGANFKTVRHFEPAEKKTLTANTGLRGT